MTTYPNYAATQRIQDLVVQFKPISLADVNQSAGLMNRIDTKYVLSQAVLRDTLSAVKLTILCWRSTATDSILLNLYYDTDSCFYRQHHNGAPNRYKVRTREYLANQRSFIEIKHKPPLGRTCKSRQPVDAIVLDDESNAFVKSRLPLGVDPLEPKLWNSFTRITLVNSQYQERITRDIDLDYCPYDFSEALELGGVVIAEVKQVERHKDSLFVSALRKLGYQPMNFSSTASAPVCSTRSRANGSNPVSRLSAGLRIRRNHEPILALFLGKSCIYYCSSTAHLLSGEPYFGVLRYRTDPIPIREMTYCLW